MTRSFSREPTSPELVDELIDLARRSPSAGNASALEWLLLDDPSALAAYWDATLPPQRRDGFAWPELLNAPVIVIPWVDPQIYLDRYREADKAHLPLGESLDAWDVPYWFVDGGAAVQTLLLAAEDAGLGALFFGLFEHEPKVRETFGVPAAQRALGAVALGHRADGRPSQSQLRRRRGIDEVLHRNSW